jgi:ribosomal protein S18 acetylase RimI-like enzyme
VSARSLSIREVSAAEFAKFHANSGKEKYARLIQAPVPFPRAFFFAEEEGTPLARVLVSQSLESGAAGGIGCLEGLQEAFPDLLQHVEAWLKSRGAKKAIGPILYTTWFPYRVRLDDLQPSFSWEPQYQVGEESSWTAASYQEIESYASRGLSGFREFAGRQKKSLEKALVEGFTFHRFEDELRSESSKTRLIDDLFDLTMESFAEAYLFQPVSRDQFHVLYVAGLADVKDLSCSYLMRDKDGSAAAFSFAFIDQDYIVFKTLAVSRKLRGRGLSNAVLSMSCEAAESQGLDKMIHALMRRGNISESFGEKSVLLWEHRYGLFAKDL